MKNKLPVNAPKYIIILLVSMILTGFGYTLSTLPFTQSNPWPTLFTWNSSIPLSRYDSNGIPVFAKISSSRLYNDSASSSPTNNPDFLNYISATLPEYVNQSNNTSLFPLNVTDANYNVYLSAAAKVEVAFVYEGAGYRNSFGYFTFDPDNPPTSLTRPNVILDKIIFPNASLYNSGGTPTGNVGLQTGDTVSLGIIDPALYPWNLSKNCTVANTCKVGIGFMVVANGFMLNAAGPVNPYPDPEWIFYSLSALNPETTLAKRRHMVLLKDPKSGLIALAMEDMNRDKGSDSDMNDIIYRLKVTPESAIANISNFYTTATKDSDGDGVPDATDEYPNDSQRATSTWYPSKTGWGTLAYEDAWPSIGDYDMNDLVVLYNYRQILRADGMVKELEIQYKLSAMGARDNNGFAVELTGIPSSTVHSATLTVDGVAKANYAATATVLGKTNNNLVFRIFNDAYAEFGLAPSADVRVNTLKSGGVSKTPVTYKLNIVFTTPLAKSAFTYAPPYNPFLFKGNSVAEEVHLPGYAPTSSVDTTRFGTFDDNTAPAARRYYVSKLGHPWAFNLPLAFKWPAEGRDLVNAYPDFKAWAESGGVQKPTWYSNPSANAAYIY